MAAVTDLITQAQNYADTVLQTANSQLGGAMGVAQGLGRTVGGYDLPEINFDIPTPGDPGEVPIFPGLAFVDPRLLLNEPELQTVPELDLSGEPGSAPQVIAFTDPGNQPVGEPGDPTLLQGAPESIDIEIPDAPDLLEEIRGIDKPRLTNITIRTAPTYREPQFNGSSPDTPPEPPAGLDSTFRVNYSTIAPVMRDAVSSQVDAFIDSQYPSFRTGLAALENRLATYLDGGTALTPEVQDAIYGRAIAKVDVEYTRARATLYREGARSGHTIPGPVLLAQAQALDNTRRTGSADVARDLMVKIAEMEQQNMQFAVTTSASLRNTMMQAALSYYSGLVQINGQALDYARSVVDAIVKVYDVAVRRVELQARIYEAEANIYRAKVQGALGILEAYTAEIRGKEAQANVDTARVNAYKARVEAVQAEADVYRAQIAGAEAQVSLLRAQVDIFQARVSAYGSQVNAYTARWSGYKSAVEGEVASVSASVEQIRGYQAQTQSYDTIVRARTAQITGITSANEGLIRQYTAAIDAYRAKVGGLSDVARAQVASFESTLGAYKAKANAVSEKSRAEIASYEAGLRAVIASAEMTFRLIHEAHNLDVERVRAISQLSTTAANNYSRLAEAAMAGMNTLVAQVAQDA